MEKKHILFSKKVQHNITKDSEFYNFESFVTCRCPHYINWFFIIPNGDTISAALSRVENVFYTVEDLQREPDKDGNEENGYTPEKHRPEKVPFFYVRGENRIERQLGYPRSARGGGERRGVVYENA